jgi:uncharacterized protein (TIGR03545 family)
MFLWKHVAPRLLLLVLFATFVLLAVDPLIRWSIVHSGRAVTGADLVVESVRTSWSDRSIELRGVRAVDPTSSNNDIFAADLIHLELDHSALGRRKAIVTRAQVSGLEVGTERRTPAIRDRDIEGEYTSKLSERFLFDGGHWLETAGQELDRRYVGNSSTVETLLDVLERFPKEYEPLELKAAETTARIRELEATLGDLSNNPLRNATSYQQAIASLDSLGRELQEVRRQADQVHQQMLMDREALAAAQEQDLESRTDEFELASLNADNLTEYLLGPEIANRVAGLSQWVRWGRNYLPALHAQSSGLRHRGENVNLLGGLVEPDILLNTVVLNGHAQVGDSRLQIEGSISGLSSQPQLNQQPAEIVVQTTGDTQLLIQASFQGTGKESKDAIVVNCPTFQLPERTLGDSNQLALKVAPAVAHYWARIDIQGDNLSGEMIIKQPSAVLQPIMGAELQRTPVAGLVSEAAGQIVAIDSSVQLSGTVDNPAWTMRSNLGHDLAQQLESGLKVQLLAQNRQAIQSLHEQIAQKSNSLGASLSDRHQLLLQSIATATESIQSVASQVASRVEQTDGIMNTTSPLRESLLR